ncbi:hypothetical protein SASPL_147027 [Salvia splendens]|uniref:Uncharacterized protein n=1 Tax=Salvia splendens TaxID=180675 RepID=A0A8X8WDQ3_SALSN|nr:hypothetical protein SASPL_147027 [Salvia splendens]
MGFGSLRSLIRPVSRILSPVSYFSPAARPFSTTSRPPQLHRLFAPLRRDYPWIPPRSAFHSLTDTRHPKRRPVDKPRRKRASLKPPGPYAWVKCVPGETILPNQPNQGSLKRRNEKKRIKQHRAFIKAYGVKVFSKASAFDCVCAAFSLLCVEDGYRNYINSYFDYGSYSWKSERKIRRGQVQEARKKKLTLRVERKMAAVARDRAWAERLVELKRIEEEKKQQAAM